MLHRHGRGRLHLRAAAVLTALLATLAAGTPAQATGGTHHGAAQQLAVPAYFYPGGDGAALWQQLNVPGVGIAVANPFSGPGKTRDPNYAAAISAAKAAGVRVLGYVATGYLGTTGRATRLNETTPAAWAAQVQQDVATWYRLYGADGLGGIFFDEVQNVCGPQDSYVKTYRALDRHVRRAQPGAFTVVNPGIDTEPCYADVGDVSLTFEGTYETYLGWQPPTWHRALDPRRFWHLVHATGTAEQMRDAVALSKQRQAGYLYVTPDVLANPWDSLPPADYWTGQLAAAADGGPDGTAPRVLGTPLAVHTTATEATVGWLPAADEGRVTGYDVYLDGVRVTGTLNALPLVTLHGLDPARSHRVAVAARDAAGNVSAPGRAATVTTKAADASPPAAPAGLRAAETKVASVRLAWTASAEADVTAYDVELDGQPLLSLPSWLVTSGDTVTVPVSGLEPGTAYTVTAYARDGSGNRSAAAGPLAVTTTLPSGDPITGAGGVIGTDGVTYQAKFNLPFDFHHLFIDVDGDAATGFATAGIGADLLIENSWFYRHTGTGWSWAPVDGPSPLVSSDDDHYVWRVPAAVLSDVLGGAPLGPHRAVFHGSGSSPEVYTAVITIS
ncbi:spherulation-specific family 4 protein [Catellatospora sp. NPDC049609]|uniref:spherulation-specific family 4 protein n=1 Tax=Catellatospora sp. NPDC049609 TaxID=3155505 RepID=UPI00341B5D7C